MKYYLVLIFMTLTLSVWGTSCSDDAPIPETGQQIPPGSTDDDEPPVNPGNDDDDDDNPMSNNLKITGRLRLIQCHTGKQCGGNSLQGITAYDHKHVRTERQRKVLLPIGKPAYRIFQPGNHPHGRPDALRRLLSGTFL